MSLRQVVMVLLLMLSCSQSLRAREIVVGIEPVAIKKMAFIFTPVVLPDLITAKMAFEYRVHNKFNVVLPLESKWMDYRRAIKWVANMVNAREKNVPEAWYKPDAQIKPGWNIDLFQFKISSGLGVKWFPFSEAMTNAFFVKAMFMAGYERFHAYGAEGRKDSAVFTQVASIGYNWVKKNRFTFGFEAGQEYSLHTNPVKGLPILLDGFLPFLQFSVGFTI
jgi:hypothetical protein